MRLAYFVILVVAPLLLSAASASPVLAGPSVSWSPAEKYVLAKVANGDVADLKDQFSNESDRTLRASFLESLIINPTNQFAIHRNGIRISNAIVSGTINLVNLDIPYFINLSGCIFDDASVFQTTFKKGLQIVNCEFKNRAYFSYVTVAGGLSMTECHFDDGADFEVLKVNGPAQFTDACFESRVSFAYAEIGILEIENTRFNSKTEDANFNSIKVDRGVFAQGATFAGNLDMVNARIGDNLEANDAHFNNTEKKVDFQMMNVGHNLYLNGAQFAGPVDLSRANVDGNIELARTTFKQLPNLTDLRYESIYWNGSLLGLIRDSHAGYSAYTELESYLQRTGDTSSADDVFIAKKRLERANIGNLFDWSLSVLDELLQGFGRKKHRALLWDLLILIIGVIVFRPRKMTIKKVDAGDNNPTARPAGNVPPPYNSFLYSLTLFAPAIDSQYTNNWEPRPERRGIKAYQRLHQAFGWVLVPLTIAIWTGVFK